MKRVWKFFQHCFVKIGANLLGIAISLKNKDVVLERRFQWLFLQRWRRNVLSYPAYFREAYLSCNLENSDFLANLVSQ